MIAHKHQRHPLVPLGIIVMLVGILLTGSPNLAWLGITLMIAFVGIVIATNLPLTNPKVAAAIEPIQPPMFYYVSDPAAPHQWLAEVANDHTVILYKEGEEISYTSATMDELNEDLARLGMLTLVPGTDPYFNFTMLDNCRNLLLGKHA